MSQNLNLPSPRDLFPGKSFPRQVGYMVNIVCRLNKFLAFIDQVGNGQKNYEQPKPKPFVVPTTDIQTRPDNRGHANSASGSIPHLEGSLTPPARNDDKRFPCELCGRRFSRPSALDTHMNSHTGEKPYPCTFPGCGKRFSARSNMQRHMRTHGTQDPPVDYNPPVQYPRNDNAQAYRRF
ncbi:hypothetical protein BDY19DRAFT_1045815 [Irpex rosettiformis]|uniref:Uncharacterized protein n=1 Tax=Irpex rosettiformis TaxID=378272 RepID=A0ACB8UFY5_9APHY|nr:hypothetical protein BDY19DRAFT_1045815 [Irpex rosettiformis]